MTWEEMVERETMPTPLRNALGAFERELSAVGYVTSAEPTYRNGKCVLVTWRDPNGYHVAFKDKDGWYEYASVEKEGACHGD